MDRDRIYFGTIANDHAKTPVWYEFDAPWYRRRYARRLSGEGAGADDTALTEHWRADEGADGTSPNRYFDEGWYLTRYPDVRRSVQEQGIFRSGFQHYVDAGCQSCMAHWLFSEEHYLRNSPDYSLRAIREAGYVNVYDHFIRVGDRARRSPHPFFDAGLLVHGCLNLDVPFDPARGALEQYLALDYPDMGRVRTSWYFDPQWYLATYPEVATLMEEGIVTGPLHHYMTCEAPEQYNPNPYFDETYYLTRYPDIREAVECGAFRNGYDHFVRSGIRERRSPVEGMDMAAFVEGLDLPAALDQAHVANPFLLWVKQQEGEVAAGVSVPSLAAANDLALRKVEASLPSLFRRPLQFRQVRQPPLGVILLSRGNYLLDIATLTSLYQQGLPEMQVLVSSTGAPLARQRLEQAVGGVACHPASVLQPASQRVQALLPELRSPHVLIIESGVQILPLAVPAALAAMEGPHTGGSGKMLTTTNRVLEAGSAVWRDGSVTLCGAGAAAQDQSVSVQRVMEAVQGGMLFCQKEDLAPALDYLAGQEGEALFTCLSMALRAVGATLSYWPAVQAKALHETPESYGRGRTPGRDRLRALFPAFLPAHAVAPGDVRAGSGDRPEVMMVFPRLPRRVEGGPARRIMQQIAQFRELGWHVLVVGLDRRDEDRLVIPHDYPADVECWRGVADVPAFLQARQAGVRLFWLGGTDVLARLGPVLASGAFTLRDKAIVLDLVSQDGTGLRAMETHMRRLVGVVDEPETLLAEARQELEHAWLCQGFIAGDGQEAALLERLGYSHVVQLPHVVTARPSLAVGEDGFGQREGILFPLSIYRAGDAGHDGFDWFCLSVMPWLYEHFGEGLPVWIGGYHHLQVDLGFYEHMARLDGLADVDSLPALFRRCRILIDPSRVLATPATEILDAAGQGLPALLGSPQMERLGWQDGRQALDGGFNDPRRFAQQLIRLYEDATLWEQIRQNAYADVCRHNGSTALHEVFSRFLEELFAPPQGLPSRRPALAGMTASARAFAPAPLHIVPRQEPPAAPAGGEAAADEDEEEELDPASLPTRLGVTLPQEDDHWKGEPDNG